MLSNLVDAFATSAPSSQYIILSLLALPAILVALYFLNSAPHIPKAVLVHPSLATLPTHFRSWQIYPEDAFTGGAYASLPLGRTRYWLLGPEDGTKIVLIPGLSMPALIWKDVAVLLAERGFRVLLYDLYGRGYSDAPQTTYDVPLFTTQLALLLQCVGWDGANICGASMGGSIAAAFAVQFPHLVRDNVALIAPTGIVTPSDLPRMFRFLASPLAQLVRSSAPFRVYLRRLSGSASRFDSALDEIVHIQSANLPGFNAAVASTIRDGPICGLTPTFVQLGKEMRKRMEAGAPDGRVLLVWGTKDAVVPYTFAAHVRGLIGDDIATLTTFEGAIHDLIVTHAEETARELETFFARSKEQKT
ncbi:alpha/beta hydrolase [Phanerochaete sordida]|uniref:Alpha/beta hydrolase n=1 Tax=Phanerochaete sordida TaxID=48140 RepID=A0A9P3GT65_9APHY|nr:alpha/beta hydrolase [Phanerochaete sordida]